MIANYCYYRYCFVLVCISLTRCSALRVDSPNWRPNDESFVYGVNGRFSRSAATSDSVTAASSTEECACVREGERPRGTDASPKNPTITLREPPATICCGVLSKEASSAQLAPFDVTSRSKRNAARRRRQAGKNAAVAPSPFNKNIISRNQPSPKNSSQNQPSPKNSSQNQPSPKNSSQNQPSSKNSSRESVYSAKTPTGGTTKTGNETTDSPARLKSDQCECVSASACDKRNVVTVFGEGLPEESEVRCSNDGDVCCRSTVYSPATNSTAKLDKSTERVDAVIVLVRDKRATVRSTSTPSGKKTSQQKGDKKQGGERVNVRGGSGAAQLVNVRVGGQSIQCGCVLFYQCDSTDVVTVDEGQDDSAVRCSGDQEVCCRVPNSLAGGAAASDNPFGSFDPSTSEQPPPEPVVNGAEQPSAPEPEVEQTSQQSSGCFCAQFSLCPNNASNTDGAGVIDKRMSCPATEVVCCPSGGAADTTSAPTRPPSPIYEPTEQTCGVRGSRARSANPIATRIVAPAEMGNTYFGEFPWMGVVLRREENSDGTVTDNVFQCGGSLVHPSVLLTAAHCVRQLDIQTLKIRMGEWDTNVGIGGEPLEHQDRRVSSVVIHPNFHAGALFNDLALVVVDGAFDIAENVNAICLRAPNGYDRQSCVATGWGKHAFDGSGRFQTILKKVDLRVVDNNECLRALRRTKLGPKFMLHESFICAGGSRGQDTCQGDGGGPLVCAMNGHPDSYVQTGVVSWGIGCGDDIPAAYASTFDYQPAVEWIQRQLDTITQNIVSS